MRLIDADDFGNRMYHEAFEKDSDLQKWDSGCWIRYKLFENVLREQPTIQPVATDTNVGDTISRQAAINALYLVDEYNARSVNAIKGLPSVQPEQKWISCSERLPDTNRDVLLQFSTSMGVGFWEHNSWGGKHRGQYIQRDR